METQKTSADQKEASSPKAHKLVVPGEIVSPTDIARLIAEIDRLSEFFESRATKNSAATEDSVDGPKVSQTKFPRLSSQLDKISKLNGLNILKYQDMDFLREALQNIFDKAPVFKISFAVEPSRAQIVKILNWMRANIKPDLLLKIGLNPSLSGGCVLDTGENVYDFSLKKYFADKRKYLKSALFKSP